jgi:sensor histidine kinase YesM
MKTLKNIIIFFLLGAIADFGYTQSPRPDPLLSYSLDGSRILISGGFVLDSSTIFLGHTKFRPPYEDQNLQLYGYSIVVKIIPAGNSPQQFLMKGSNISELLIDKSDTTKRSKPLFDLLNIQVRFVLNGEQIGDWKNLQQIAGRETPDKLTGKSNLILPIGIGRYSITSSLEISFRNPRLKGTLITFHIQHKDEKYEPFLAKFEHDTSTKYNYETFKQQQLELAKVDLPKIDRYYKYWSTSLNPLLCTINNEHFYTNSKVALYFRKPYLFHYVNESMEYALLTGKVKDTVWQSTGHLLILPKLQSGRRYSLLVRYNQNAQYNGVIKVYTFYTDKNWYQTYYAIIIGSSIILLLAFFLIRYRMRLAGEKKRVQMLKYNLQSIRSQLNPHFVFNSLSSIQGLINTNKVKEANYYLTEFSDILRESLRNNDKEYIPLDKELSLLETYLSLEKLRFNFQYTISVEDTIEQSVIEVPALLLQPVIENAIKHGAGPLYEAGKIVISFTIEKSSLHISVSDNGAGFDINTEKNDGYGTRLTKERIALLNLSLHGQAIKMDTRSSANGTIVYLIFENWL